MQAEDSKTEFDIVEHVLWSWSQPQWSHLIVMMMGACAFRGWADLGEGFDIPDTVMLLDDVPHDWLLPRCSAVVHHGGAGTTAAGMSPPPASCAFRECSPMVSQILLW